MKRPKFPFFITVAEFDELTRNGIIPGQPGKTFFVSMGICSFLVLGFFVLLEVVGLR